MPRHRFALVLAASLVLVACQSKIRYSATRKSDHVDVYHGTKVADPYRWLEDLDSAETRRWVRRQNEVTFGYLKTIPERNAIRERIESLQNFERYGVPFSRAGRYFFTRNDGLQNQPVFYTADSMTGSPRVLLDPNQLSTDGTVATSRYTVTRDGRYLAYSIQRSGSDWLEWKVRDVNTGEDLPDHIRWSKFSPAAWLADGSGFYYGRYPEPTPGKETSERNVDYRLYFHKRGTDQSEDELIYERPDHPEWGFYPEVTEDGRYLVVTIWQGSQNEVSIYYMDLAAGDRQMHELLPDFDAEYELLDTDGDTFWFKTNKNAPMGRVVAIDRARPQQAHWKELVPESTEALQSARSVGQHFLLSYLKDAKTEVRLFDLNGAAAGNITLPAVGSAGGFTGRRKDGETFFRFTSFTFPPTVVRFEFATGNSTLVKQPKTDFDPSDFQVEQVFYESKDGTRIPMFLTYKKGLKKDGRNPTYLYGYGGFNATETPYFSVSNLVWMEMGGIYAMPNLRGGGEYGEAWHKAGVREKKQNVFDDFIAAAEWLIAEGYTSSEKLAIGGGSNGGLLVGACLTQRPELYGAALPAVGVMDMLRYHKHTIGWAWVAEYGSSEDADAFRWLHAYSPLHNLKPGVEYPATMVTTADHDDRVVPSHSFKFTATMQAHQTGNNPVLIRIETKAGHGAGVPMNKRIAAVADRWAFLVRTLQVDVPASFRR